MFLLTGGLGAAIYVIFPVGGWRKVNPGRSTSLKSRLAILVAAWRCTAPRSTPSNKGHSTSFSRMTEMCFSALVIVLYVCCTAPRIRCATLLKNRRQEAMIVSNCKPAYFRSSNILSWSAFAMWWQETRECRPDSLMVSAQTRLRSVGRNLSVSPVHEGTMLFRCPEQKC